jgi:hypothetical protein
MIYKFKLKKQEDTMKSIQESELLVKMQSGTEGNHSDSEIAEKW